MRRAVMETARQSTGPAMSRLSPARFLRSCKNTGDEHPAITYAIENHRLGAMDWKGRSLPHVRQDIDASLVTPADGKPGETKKALLRRCFKPRSPCETRGAPVQLRLPVCPGDIRGLLSSTSSKPARSHRHVRMWGEAYLCASPPPCKRNLQRSRRNFHASATKEKPANYFVFCIC